MEGWVGINALENSERTTSLEIRKQRVTIMTINYVAWYWLDVFVVDRCKTILGDKLDSNTGWLVRLVLDVKEHHEHRHHTPRTFRPSSYGLNLGEESYTLDVSGRRFSSDPTRQTITIASVVVKILQSWLHYPTDKASRQKAWFVHVIRTEFGRNALYLEGTHFFATACPLNFWERIPHWLPIPI